MQFWSRIYPPEDIDFPSFAVRNPGPTNMPAVNSSPIVHFLLFLTLETLGKIVTKTKKYAAWVLGARALSPRSGLSRWDSMDFSLPFLNPEELHWTCYKYGPDQNEEGWNVPE